MSVLEAIPWHRKLQPISLRGQQHPSWTHHHNSNTFLRQWHKKIRQDFQPLPRVLQVSHANASATKNRKSRNTYVNLFQDFCLVPIGTPTASVSKEVAEVQRLLKKSGVKYSMHSAGTTLEGSWAQVMEIIGQCHSLLHANGVVRIQTDIRVGSRTDKKQSSADKVKAVEKLLAEDDKSSS